MPTFFHGSTDVRTSSLRGSFSEHPVTQHAGLCFRLSSAMSSAWRLASFRRACRADQAVAHAIELDLDERLLDESSGCHLVYRRLTFFVPWGVAATKRNVSPLYSPENPMKNPDSTKLNRPHRTLPFVLRRVDADAVRSSRWASVKLEAQSRTEQSSFR